MKRKSKTPHWVYSGGRGRFAFIQTDATSMTASMKNFSSLANQSSFGRCSAAHSHVLPQWPLELAYPKTFLKTRPTEPAKGISGGIAVKRKATMQIIRSRQVERKRITAGIKRTGTTLISDARPKNSPQSSGLSQHSSA